MTTRKALVAGGGIAGPAAAMALQKAGIEATIYEAHPEGADGAGVFLTLGSNGVDALRTLGMEITEGFETPSIELRGGNGKILGLSRISTSRRDVPASRTIKRADLYRALYEEALRRGIKVEHGKRLVDAEETADGVTARFADGTEATGDLLIGCDGVHSAVRGLIDPKAPAPDYAGLISLGGYTRTKVDAEPGSYTMIFGRKAFFGYAMAAEDEVWWFANVPRADRPQRGEVEAVGSEEWKKRLLEAFGQDAGAATQILEATEPQDLMKASPVHLIKKLPAWHRGRMVVIGDAAHAPSPTSGQGASLSIEDAVVLAKCLRDHDTHDQAFQRFVERSRPRVEKIVKAAARINNSKAAGPVGRLFLALVLPKILKAAANSKSIDETYGHHIPWS